MQRSKEMGSMLRPTLRWDKGSGGWRIDVAPPLCRSPTPAEFDHHIKYS